jgi:hypothetical protein
MLVLSRLRVFDCGSCQASAKTGKTHRLMGTSIAHSQMERLTESKIQIVEREWKNDQRKRYISTCSIDRRLVWFISFWLQLLGYYGWQ